MNEIKIQTFNELHNVIEDYDPRTVIDRGVKSVKYPLVPKIGQIVPPPSAKSREWNEKEILRLSKEQALPYLDFMPSHYSLLFPGLDSLAAHIEWLQCERQ